MNFWKEHPALRLALIAIFFLLGMALVLVGWRMTGKLGGLGLMLLGLASLLAALAIYNKPFEEPKR
jgi:peptidoglycan/LPS O-acetylase OafA/YrhL